MSTFSSDALNPALLRAWSKVESSLGLQFDDILPGTLQDMLQELRDTRALSAIEFNQAHACYNRLKRLPDDQRTRILAPLRSASEAGEAPDGALDMSTSSIDDLLSDSSKASSHHIIEGHPLFCPPRSAPPPYQASPASVSSVSSGLHDHSGSALSVPSPFVTTDRTFAFRGGEESAHSQSIPSLGWLNTASPSPFSDSNSSSRSVSPLCLDRPCTVPAASGPDVPPVAAIPLAIQPSSLSTSDFPAVPVPSVPKQPTQAPAPTPSKPVSAQPPSQPRADSARPLPTVTETRPKLPSVRPSVAASSLPLQEGDGSFQVVCSKRRPRAKVDEKLPKDIPEVENCPDHCKCSAGSECHFIHSARERRIILLRRTSGNPNVKTHMCFGSQGGACKFDKDNCIGAHGRADGWCAYCGKCGHLIAECPTLHSSNKTPKKL